MQAAMRSVAHARLKLSLIDWHAENVKKPLNPAIKTYILKSIAEIRTYVVLAINRFIQLNIHARNKRLESDVIARHERGEPFLVVDERMKGLWDVYDRRIFAEALELDELQGKLVTRPCINVEAGLKDECYLKAHLEFEAAPKKWDTVMVGKLPIFHLLRYSLRLMRHESRRRFYVGHVVSKCVCSSEIAGGR